MLEKKQDEPPSVWSLFFRCLGYVFCFVLLIIFVVAMGYKNPGSMLVVVPIIYALIVAAFVFLFALFIQMYKVQCDVLKELRRLSFLSSEIKAAAISVGKIEKSLLPENNDDAPYKENKL
jgi:hypothetical protein